MVAQRRDLAKLPHLRFQYLNPRYEPCLGFVQLCLECVEPLTDRTGRLELVGLIACSGDRRPSDLSRSRQVPTDETSDETSDEDDGQSTDEQSHVEYFTWTRPSGPGKTLPALGPTL